MASPPAIAPGSEATVAIHFDAPPRMTDGTSRASFPAGAVSSPNPSLRERQGRLAVAEAGQLQAGVTL